MIILTLFREEVFRIGFVFLDNTIGGRATGLVQLIAT